MAMLEEEIDGCMFKCDVCGRLVSKENVRRRNGADMCPKHYKQVLLYLLLPTYNSSLTMYNGLSLTSRYVFERY